MRRAEVTSRGEQVILDLVDEVGMRVSLGMTPTVARLLADELADQADQAQHQQAANATAAWEAYVARARQRTLLLSRRKRAPKKR